MLLGINVATSIVNGVISNNACMVLMFPICVRVRFRAHCCRCCVSRVRHAMHSELMCCCVMVQANQLAPDVSLRQMVCVMMMAGSTDFLTPIGYQTNMMVRPYGNYKFLDYTKFGFLLSVGAQHIAAGMTLVLIK